MAAITVPGLPVELMYPDRMGSGERKSKLLMPGSPLHAFVEEGRGWLRSRGYAFDTRPPHVEVTRSGESEHDTLARGAELHGRVVDVSQRGAWGRMGRALVLQCGRVTGYGETHVTIAFFGHGGLDDALVGDMAAWAADKMRCRPSSHPCRIRITMAHHGHDDAHGAVAATGEPTPYLGDPSKTSVTRCKRRWNDLVLMRLDALAPANYSGASPRFTNQADVYKAIRERYLLFVSCLESKPGSEPTNPYLYPQAPVASLH